MTVARRSVALSALAMLFALVYAPPASAAFPGGVGRIVFADVEYRLLWTINPDGSDLRNTTVHGSDPAASPDGRFVAFACFDPKDGSAEICVMRPGGSDPHPITHTVPGGRSLAEPAWAPDGTHLIAAGYRFDGSSDLYRVNAVDGSLTNLTATAGNDWNPAWSPDGTRIAFNSRRDGVAGIWSMNADGSDQHRLGDGADPSWSPDGGRIAFSYAGDIWTMAPDGTGLQQIPGSGSTNEQAPAWSPDGRSILYTRPINALNGTSDVFVMDVDGTDQQTVTFGYKTGVRFNVTPDWIPIPGAVFRPDAIIARYSGGAVGDNVYSPDGEDQTVTNFRSPGRRAWFVIAAQNDGNRPESLRYSGCGPTDDFTVRYALRLGNGQDVTVEVKRGHLWTFELGPGGYLLLYLKMTLASDVPIGGVYDCRVQVHSSHDLHALDGVRARLIVVEEPPPLPRARHR